jgi:hypothetical protein
MLSEPIEVARPPPVLHEEVLALDIPQLAETVHEGRAADSPKARREGQIPDPGEGRWLLRLGGERQR